MSAETTEQWAMRVAFPLMNELCDLGNDWTRQDDELNAARCGLEPEDRTNEAEEDKRLNATRQHLIAAVLRKYARKEDV